MTIRSLHRICAIPIAVFALVHLANHLISLVSISSHLAFMEAARRVYRQPAIEAVLLLAMAFQIGSGMSFVIRRWRRLRGFIAWLQFGSGIYLAFFLCVHVGAVLIGRSVLTLDTNFYFAAAGFHVPPYQYVFAPYYFFAVLSLFTHLGCAAYWRLNPANSPARTLAVALPSLVGGIVALMICLSLAGMIQPVDVPDEFKATYAR
jgi:succinate dehydrogenase/fumarate reductase cytochrome b subunit